MLQAVICAWNEEDIIASTVKHAFAQGCDAVHLIDNRSTDRTVQQALRAGARLHEIFATDGFDETEKTVRINKCVLERTAASPDERNWWLYLDADEFPDFGAGKTIRETLAALPPDVRAVAGRYCNHIPTHAPYIVPGLHPADFMPLGIPEVCEKGNYSLLRQDKSLPPLFSSSGSHGYVAGETPIREAEVSYLVHHFPLRRPDLTRKRLEALILPDANGKRRIATLDKRSRETGNAPSPYHDRLASLDRVYAENALRALKEGTLGYDFRALRRWYDPTAVEPPRDALTEREYLVWKGTHAYFLGEYGTALPCLAGALALATEEREKGLLALGTARCCLCEGAPVPGEAAAALVRSPLPEIRDLAREVLP